MGDMTVAYLDTNIYNRLAASLTLEEIPRLSAAAARLNTIVTISPTNVIELLATPNAGQRDKLVLVAQHLAVSPLLAEVEAIVVDYAARVLGDQRVAHLRLESPTAREPLLGEWRKVWEDPRRSLWFEEGTENRIEAIKQTFNLLHATVTRGLNLHDVIDEGELNQVLGGGAAAVATRLREKARWIRKQPPALVRDPQYGFHRALLSAMILAVGYSPFPSAIDDFWDALGMHELTERLDFLYGPGARLMDEGPLLPLYDLAAWQSLRPYNPGNWLDTFHLQYLQIAKIMYTCDGGLLEYGGMQPSQSRLRNNLIDGTEFVRELAQWARRG